MRYLSSNIIAGLIFISIVGLSCSHKPISKKLSESLDVKFKKEFDITKTQNVTTDTSPTAIIIDWKKFFKPFPNEYELKLIAKKIDSLSAVSQHNIEQLFEMGRNYVAIGKLKEAEVQFLKILRYDENNIEALLELAQIYLNKKDFEKSFDVLQDLNKILLTQNNVRNDQIFRYRYILAVVYLNVGDIEKGRDILSDLIIADKTFVPAYLALASSYLENDKIRLAEFIVRQGLAKNTDEPGFYNILGLIEQKKSNLILAKNYFDKALSLQKTYVPALVNRANIAIINGELEPAKEDLTKALLYSPLNVDAYVSLAICQKKLGLINKAKESLENAMKIDPQNPWIRLNYAILLLEDMNQPQVALRYFNEVLQIENATLNIKNIASYYVNTIKNSAYSTYTY